MRFLCQVVIDSSRIKLQLCSGLQNCYNLRMKLFLYLALTSLFTHLSTSAAENPTVKHFNFTSQQKKLKVWYAAPEKLTNETRLLFVMHGVKRNGEDYCRAWLPYAKSKNLMIVVPEFSNEQFPGSSKYNLANMSKSSKEFNKPDSWHFGIIEELFSATKEKLNLTFPKYNIYGHSAGAQFVHRFVMFGSSPNLDLAISANAGWYTFPNTTIDFPYGIKGLDNAQQFTKRAFAKKMTILLGDEDTDPNHKYLRKAKEAMAQGKHRFSRGNTFFQYAQTLAKTRGFPFAWKVQIAKGVDHSNTGMAKHAAELLGKN